MGWRDLLQTGEETLVAPWVGGRSLRTFERSWRIEGRLPPEHGWYTFKGGPRRARVEAPSDALSDALQEVQYGYLVGDRFISESSSRVSADLNYLVSTQERVHLVEPGLDRFSRISVGRFCEDGPLIYRTQEFPLGPEQDVLTAFLDEAGSLEGISGITPALDVAFRIESWRRSETERIRREEFERREQEERQRLILEQRGTGAGRRSLAQEDFAEGARAALAVGGATYLDHRQAPNPGEMIVRFRLGARRYECVCSRRTLQIIDAGVCLTAETGDPDFERGTVGDTWLTLESLPPVILDADRAGRLVVFRHVD